MPLCWCDAEGACINLASCCAFHQAALATRAPVLIFATPPPSKEGSALPDSWRLPQRLELEIDPDLYARLEDLSRRSGRSIPEIIQGLISASFPLHPAERVFSEPNP